MTPRLSGHFPLFGLAFSLCSGIVWDRDSTIQELTGKKSAQIFSFETTWNLPLSLELRSLKKLLPLRAILTVLTATALKRLIKIKETSPSPSKNVVPLTVPHGTKNNRRTASVSNTFMNCTANSLILPINPSAYREATGYESGPNPQINPN